ncbi:helix-turn-helix domain-containing protein [Enterococcus pallens]|uniref:M protein trans-acting positive regulator (MGA) HTH domain-containing protein n=1 Tax=Enterococcus pallens ATCC BAA-351 TaxID=1158607 RepID=R2QLZ5_9ENTE|nr:helix-turn-helix domain-containing protein [Enterococcus pallens]EOH97587.1 hypothetical protein UAU_00255 [Enterococcus pallens ATCC BAA-351]EOU20994.1 hypothetical protein I588_01841 [Enterococcus pallens ATCC BAA-351]OJG80126.1 hypothetical protein RV10_GL004777 [Enterococcus pallens]
MLEHFIEKNVFRQVYLCEQLYDKKTIQIHEVAEQLEVCPVTVRNDLDTIVELLEPQIQTVEKARNSCRIIFDPACSHLELTQTIYQRSNFLAILAQYLTGERNWSTMADNTFISLSKVYTIRNDLMQFLAEMDYLTEAGEVVIPEKDYRYLLLALSRYTNQNQLTSLNHPLESACQQLIDYVERHFFSRSYPPEERQLIQLGVSIGLQRAKTNPVFFTTEEKELAQHTPLFQLIHTGLQQTDFALCRTEDEQFYVYSLFNSRNYLSNSLELMQKDFKVVYQNHIQYNPLVANLAQRLNTSLNLSKEDQLLFEKAFLPFIRSTWADTQLFLPEKIYLLDPQQRELYRLIDQILRQWTKEHGLALRWNDNLIRKFTTSVSLLLTDQSMGTIEVFIAAPTDFKFLYYHQLLTELLSEHFTVSSMICSDLAELVDDTFFCTERIILCDTSLYQDDLKTENTQVYPITFHTVHNVITQLNQQVCRLSANDC